MAYHRNLRIPITVLASIVNVGRPYYYLYIIDNHHLRMNVQNLGHGLVFTLTPPVLSKTQKLDIVLPVAYSLCKLRYYGGS